MRIEGQPHRTIWRDTSEPAAVAVIDQTLLPHRFAVETLRSAAEAARAIRDMTVRGAPLIGATGAYGLALAMAEAPGNDNLREAFDRLLETRPTAVNLRWGLERMRRRLERLPEGERAAAAFAEAGAIADEDVAVCSALGEHGCALIRAQFEKAGGRRPVEILTHCNAGWLATVDWGTALAPIYKAHRAGVPVHVWVDETRPRNQGASLTAYELGQEGVPHTIVVDNVGGHLMQHGKVDLCIVGTDRTTRRGDVCNKIGTYLKALAADDNGVPFYVALPSSTIDWRMSDGVAEIPIEERSPREVTHMTGVTEDGAVETVRVTPAGSPALNYGFDVTPARLVTGLITEMGVCPASEQGLLALFPGRKPPEPPPMCGRYAITLPPEAVRAWFGYGEQPNFPPRFNVAPTQPIPIVTRGPERPSDPARHFRLVRWGLVPAFVKDFSRFPLIINARSEEIADKPSFRAALMRRRCLVIADGYYEWRRDPLSRKAGTPFLFRRADGRPIGFAGLWERWMGAEGSELESACIATTAANGSTAAVHPRMPVILEPGDFEAWLDVDGVTARDALALLRPAGEDVLDIFAIGPAVNKVANDDPSVQEPIAAPRNARAETPPTPPRQGSLF